jgi:hypothetical protein
MRSKCYECGVRGTILGVPEDVVPEKILCGNCEQVSDHRPTRYELIAQVYQGELTAPFYLLPDYRTTTGLLRCPHCNKRHHNGKPVNGVDVFRCLGCGQTWHHQQAPAPPDRRQEWLKKASTRQVLALFISVRGYGHYDETSLLNFTIEELKAELALREHIPNKPEAKELRRKRAQGKAV